MKVQGLKNGCSNGKAEYRVSWMETNHRRNGYEESKMETDGREDLAAEML